MADIVTELSYVDPDLNAYTGAEAADELLALIESAGHDGRHLHSQQQAQGLIDALAKAVSRLLTLEKQRARGGR